MVSFMMFNFQTEGSSRRAKPDGRGIEKAKKDSNRAGKQVSILNYHAVLGAGQFFFSFLPFFKSMNWC